MARPTPNTLLKSHNAETAKTTLIVASESIWAVYFDDCPINIKTTSTIAFIAPKYRNTSFANKGHAINLAKKLNIQFDTNKFTVVIFDNAKTIYHK